MHDTAPGRIAELLDAYLAADYRWELDGQWRRVQVGESAHELETAFPDATRFAMLSAWNPHSEPRDDVQNRRADDALHYELATGPYPYRPAFASASDRTWREPSWLVVGIPSQPLDALASRFGQLATLAWRRGEPVRLRMDAPAPADHVLPGCVDWLK